MLENSLTTPSRHSNWGQSDESRFSAELWHATPDESGLLITQFRPDVLWYGSVPPASLSETTAVSELLENPQLGVFYQYLGVAQTSTEPSLSVFEERTSVIHPLAINKKIDDLDIPRRLIGGRLLPIVSGIEYTHRSSFSALTERQHLVDTYGVLAIHDLYEHVFAQLLLSEAEVEHLATTSENLLAGNDPQEIKNFGGSFDTYLGHSNFSRPVLRAIELASAISRRSKIPAREIHDAPVVDNWKTAARALEQIKIYKKEDRSATVKMLHNRIYDLCDYISGALS